MSEYSNNAIVSSGTARDIKSEILEIFRENLPEKPYMSNDLERYGLKIRPKNYAQKFKLIQPNKPTDLKWLLFDIDRSESAYDWHNEPIPAPNITAINPKNGHCHHFYGLKTPVYEQNGASQSPIRYADAIYRALNDKLHGDPRYSKLIAKNPLNDYWITQVWTNELYELDDLADWLDLPKHQRNLKDAEIELGLGRNCTLFDVVRFWAYREIRIAPKLTAEDCIDYARKHNDFDIPLPDTECKSIGKSVDKWVNNHMTPDKLREWHVKQAKKGRKNAQNKAQKRLGYAMIAAYEGKHHAEIANELGISLDTVKHMGLERADPRKAAVVAFKATHPDASVRVIAAATGVPKSSVARYLQERVK